jgi:hypothetical protein
LANILSDLILRNNQCEIKSYFKENEVSLINLDPFTFKYLAQVHWNESLMFFNDYFDLGNYKDIIKDIFYSCVEFGNYKMFCYFFDLYSDLLLNEDLIFIFQATSFSRVNDDEAIKIFDYFINYNEFDLKSYDESFLILNYLVFNRNSSLYLKIITHDSFIYKDDINKYIEKHLKEKDVIESFKKSINIYFF